MVINSLLMRGFYLVIFNLLVLVASAQEYANFVVQSDDSVKFLLEIDDVLQTDTARFNVKVEGIKEQSHSVRLTLVDNGNEVVEKALFFQQMNVESTMKLVHLNGEYKLRYFGEVSMGAAPIQESQTVVQFRSGEHESTPVTTDLSSMSKVEAYSYNFQNNDDLVSFEVENLTTTDATIASSTLNVNPEPEINDSLILDSLAPLLDTNKVYNPEILEVVYNYNGEKGCSFPDFEVDDLIATINASPFSSQKMKAARNGVKGQCITTAQVEQIANTLEFEDAKLSFIKFAYSYTYDKQNYRTLLKLFNFKSTQTDFLEFIKA